eukprot:TRINITY_DN43720_c0_g1_i1.p1 TRINITY_DN43720_c0_g1~~TRINITY_DN43720_c0_g1_i1.p1  ORF type:complete len:228 (-),score=50.22 TRINITY_DN43720_c0_g1_i1:418-1101(-)
MATDTPPPPPTGTSLAPLASYDHLVKLLIIGEAEVGKTSLMVRFLDGSFSASQMMTVGVDFRKKDVLRPSGKTVRMQIWDTAGQEIYRTISNMYYRGASGVLLVYDCTRDSSFLKVGEWCTQVQEQCPPGVPIVLVGNKAEPESDIAKAVSTEDGQDFAARNGMLFFETSAKSGMNVEDAFGRLTDAAVERLEEQRRAADEAEARNPPAATVELRSMTVPQEKKKCC